MFIVNWFVSHQCHYKDNFDGEHTARVTRQRERETEREREPQTWVVLFNVIMVACFKR